MMGESSIIIPVLFNFVLNNGVIGSGGIPQTGGLTIEGDSTVGIATEGESDIVAEGGS